MSDIKKVGAIRIDDQDLNKILASKAEGNNYIGAGDHMLDFGKASSFIQEDKTGRSFQVTLKNEGDEDVLVSLCDGLIGNDGVTLSDGTDAVSGLTIVGTPRKSEMFAAFVKANPIRINSIRVKADELEQLDEPIVFKEDLPFSNASDEQRIPANYQSATDTKNIVTIDDVQGWVLSSNHQMIYNVKAGRSVTLTFLLGASLNLSRALNAKAQDAIENVALAYARSGKN